MKVKKIYTVLLVCILAMGLTLSGCAKNTGAEGYEFLHEPDQIISIEVVEHAGYEVTVIREIEESVRSDFLVDFQNMPCKRRTISNDPEEVEIGDKGVKIAYENGDYEIIFFRRVQKNRNNFNSYTYRYVFDEEAFDQLIEKYAEEKWDIKTLSYDAIGNPTSYYNGTRWATISKKKNRAF